MAMTGVFSRVHTNFLGMPSTTWYQIRTKTLHKQNSSQILDPTKIVSDMIGPPNPVSNLRPIVFKKTNSESDLENHFREKRIEVQQWNQEFWTRHNARFLNERDEFIKKNLQPGKDTLTADEMSVFYKAFLDKNWKLHVNYNIMWYNKNFTMLLMAIKVRIMNMLKFK